MKPDATSSGATDVNVGLLRDWPLPMPGAGGDKEKRGHVLVVAGSREIPGALLLAATAALRAGAGKLTLATAASVAPHVGLAMPEARVIGLAETADGGLAAEPDAAAARALRETCRKADAVLIGPGMQDEAATVGLVRTLLADCAAAPLILDACAMQVVRALEDEGLRFPGPVMLTPHAGEMAGLTGLDKEAVSADQEGVAAAAAQRWQALVALKGALTIIAAPDGRRWAHRGGNGGLAISGSGDVLAGLMTGLAARGAAPEQAAVWGVALHALAGEQLALAHGPLGYLARELSTPIPALLRVLAAH
jgi:hydroxyethylthiazole kinase-like uncharacterized protein yjeF